MFMRKWTMKRKKRGFNHCKKLPRRRVKDRLYFEAATHSYIGVLIFFQILCKIPVKEFIFCNVGYRPAALLKKEIFLKLTKNLVNIVRSFWTRFSLKKYMYIYERSHWWTLSPSESKHNNWMPPPYSHTSFIIMSLFFSLQSL